MTADTVPKIIIAVITLLCSRVSVASMFCFGSANSRTIPPILLPFAKLCREQAKQEWATMEYKSHW